MNDVLKDICKIGQGAACCKYLLAGENGFECAKTNGWKDIVDNNWKTVKHTAQGDNCEGKNSLVLNFKPETQN